MKAQRESLPCEVEIVGVLARHMPTRLIEISRSGCLLESSHRIEEGTVGVLRLEAHGRSYWDEVRTTRCVTVEGMGSSYLVGVEFLRTGNTESTSIRRAMWSALNGQAPRSL